MTRSRLWATGVVAIGAGVLALSIMRPVDAARPYNNRSLNGDYVGSVIEIRQDPAGVGPIEHCDLLMEMSFNGRGGGFGTITRRCSDDPLSPIVDSQPFTYNVASDATLVIEFSDGTDGEGWLALDGDVVYVSAINDPDARIHVRSGSIARQ